MNSPASGQGVPDPGHFAKPVSCQFLSISQILNFSIKLFNCLILNFSFCLFFTQIHIFFEFSSFFLNLHINFFVSLFNCF